MTDLIMISSRGDALRKWQSGNPMRKYSEFYDSFEEGFNHGYKAVNPKLSVIKLSEVIEKLEDDWLVLFDDFLAGKCDSPGPQPQFLAQGVINFLECK